MRHRLGYWPWVLSTDRAPRSWVYATLWGSFTDGHTGPFTVLLVTRHHNGFLWRVTSEDGEVEVHTFARDRESVEMRVRAFYPQARFVP